MKSYTFKLAINEVDFEINVNAVNESTAKDAMWHVVRKHTKVHGFTVVEQKQSKFNKLKSYLSLCLN